METIKLPMVKGEVSIDFAVQKMRAARRSGIVWERSPSEFRLLTAFNLARAAATRDLMQAETYPVQAPNITGIAESTPAPYLDLNRLMNSLADSFDFGLLAAGPHRGAEEAILLIRTPKLPLVEAEPPECFCAQGRHAVDCGGPCSLHPNSPILSLSGF